MDPVHLPRMKKNLPKSANSDALLLDRPPVCRREEILRHIVLGKLKLVVYEGQPQPGPGVHDACACRCTYVFLLPHGTSCRYH